MKGQGLWSKGFWLRAKDQTHSTILTRLPIPMVIWGGFCLRIGPVCGTKQICPLADIWINSVYPSFFPHLAYCWHFPGFHLPTFIFRYMKNQGQKKIQYKHLLPSPQKIRCSPTASQLWHVYGNSISLRWSYCIFLPSHWSWMNATEVRDIML